MINKYSKRINLLVKRRLRKTQRDFQKTKILLNPNKLRLTPNVLHKNKTIILINFLFILLFVTFAFLLTTSQFTYQNGIAKAENELKLNQADYAINAYHDTDTLSTDQDADLQNRIKEASLEKANSQIYNNALKLYYKNGFKEATLELSQINRNSFYYKLSINKIAEIKNFVERETSITNSLKALINQEILDESQYKYKAALNDLNQEQTLLNANSFFETDLTDMNKITAKMNEINKLIQAETAEQNSNTKVPILMYHYIKQNPTSDNTLGGLFVTPEDFNSQMQYISQNGYNTVTMTDVVNAMKGKTFLPSKPIVLTFDDGYDDFYNTAVPILNKYHLKAEAYIITNFIGRTDYMTWEQLKELTKNPLITIGSHTLDHPNLKTISIPDIDNELTESKKMLETNLGIGITDFCYPYGGYTDETAKRVEAAGYTNATTTMPGDIHPNDNLFEITRVRVSGGEGLNGFIGSLQ